MIQQVISECTPLNLNENLSKREINNVFLVTGKNSFESSGAKEFINEALKGKNYFRFSEFDQNPKLEDALIGSSLLSKANFDAIIAIGGGSVIDMAKLINVFSANSDIPPLKIIENPSLIKNKGKLVIAIPTTAGTGSEATHFAVVYNEKIKYSVAHESILPEIIGFQSDFLSSQSKYLKACAGLDALSQAIESYWSVGSSTESLSYANEAIRLILDNIEASIENKNQKNDELLLKGAYLAGKAINISKTTAAHAVSYAFTTYYSIPHGHAVFLTLPEFLLYNYYVTSRDANDKRGPEYTKRRIEEIYSLFGVTSAEEAKLFLRDLGRRIGIELSLKKLKVVNIDLIAENVNLERLSNNPRSISKPHLTKMLTDLKE